MFFNTYYHNVTSYHCSLTGVTTHGEGHNDTLITTDDSHVTDAEKMCDLYKAGIALGSIFIVSVGLCWIYYFCRQRQSNASVYLVGQQTTFVEATNNLNVPMNSPVITTTQSPRSRESSFDETTVLPNSVAYKAISSNNSVKTCSL